VLGQPRVFTFTASDSFALDDAGGYTYSINWGDGGTQTVLATANNNTITGSHSYTTTGTFSVSVTATDQFGLASTAVTQSITIGLAQVQADSASQGGTAGLAISGTSATGGVILAPGAAANSIKVTRGGTVLGTFVPTGGNIAIYGDGGNDVVTVTGVANSANTFSLAGNTATFTAASLGTNVFTIVLGGINSVTFKGGNSGNSFSNTAATVASVLAGGTGANTYTFAGAGMGAATTIQGKGSSNTVTGPTLAANQTNVWTISSTNAGNLNGSNWAFTGVQNLVGGANDDQFEFTGSGSVAGGVSGAGAFSAAGNTLDFSSATAATVSVNLATSKATGIGTTFAGIQTVNGQPAPSTPDTLTGASVASAWTITGANSGTVSGLNFVNFGNLTGGSAVDTFTVDTGGSLAGTVNGGGGSNVLVGPDLPSTFSITAKNAGNLTSSTGVLNFTSIQNLTGGAQANVFVFSPGFTIAGNLSGGTGGGTLNYTGYTTAVTVNLQTNKATGVTGLATNLDGASGGSGTNTLIGANTANTWNITGANSGTVNSFNFGGFGSLTGGTVSDTFTIGTGGSLTGTLTGIAGSTSTLVGSSLASTFTITATNAGTLTSSSGILNFKSITILMGGSSGDVLVARNTANTWNISGPNSGTLNAFTFAGIANLMGGTAADTFTVGANGSLTGMLSGGGGTDALNGPNVASTFTLSGSNAGNLSTSTPVIPTFTQIAKLNGGTATNTLIGAGLANTWNITGTSAGNINGLLTFTAFANLTGGGGNDDFVFSNGKGVTGTIAGGGGTDQLDYSKYTTGVYVNLLMAMATGAGAVTGIRQVKGSGHNDVLVGDGTGIQLVETAGKNLLIGGTGGQATLDGGSGQDIIIAGSTIYDNNQAALQAIESYWSTSTGTFAARVAALSSASGIAGGYRLNTSTVTEHEGSGDTIVLVSANDWVFWRMVGAGADTVTGTPKQSTMF
jgi:PKD domain